MLEGVGVDIAFAQCFVWQNVVVEGHQLNVKAILVFRQLSARLQRPAVRHQQ